MHMTDRALPSLPDTVSYPKLGPVSAGYRYYPGYSRAFVRDILAEWPQNHVILDPWNGSGATTAVAAELGLQCIGIDLNPAMLVIARAALLTGDDIATIRRQAYRLHQLREGVETIDDDDPLLEWLDTNSVARVRSTQVSLVGAGRLAAQDVTHLGGAQAFWLTALFQVVRQATKGWRSSNPTWVKSRRGSRPAELTWDEIAGEMHRAGGSATAVRSDDKVTACVMIGSSTELSAYGFEPDLVFGSPPYFTRIDYAVATRVELSVLGLTPAEQSVLRRQLIGTTTVPRVETALGPQASTTARRTLDAVRQHPSKASASYYAKWLAQYLEAYTTSLVQVARVTAPGGTIGLVVQGSYYKDVYLDLPKITTDILGGLGWDLFHSYDFQPRRSLAQINPRAVAYREGAPPSEHALFFRSG